MGKTFDVTPENNVSLNILSKGPTELSDDDINALMEDNPFGITQPSPTNSNTQKVEKTVNNETSKTSTSEKELQEEVERLKKQLAKEKNTNSDIPSIWSTSSKSKTFKYKNKDYENTIVYDVLNAVSNWKEAQRKVFLYILKKTECGNLQDVQLSRREIETKVLRSGRLYNQTMESLIESELISSREGYFEDTKRIRTFYSVNLNKLFH